MDATRRIVLLETGMAATWVALALLQVGPEGLRGAWWVAALAAVGFATFYYADEHRLGGVDGWSRYALAAALVVGATVGTGSIVVLTGLSLPKTVAGVLVGAAVALIAYRFLYGVVRPVPDARLERARDRAV